VALKISRDLIAAKLEGQALVMSQDFGNPGVAEEIATFRTQLADADSFGRIRLIESQAARAYWNAWGDIPVMYPREDLKHIRTLEDIWPEGLGPYRFAGLATNPPNAMLNFATHFLKQSRLALAAPRIGPWDWPSSH